MTTQSPARSIIDTLVARGQTLAIAESLTGGGLGFALTQIPGSSAVFLGGFMSYTSEVKVRELGVAL